MNNSNNQNPQYEQEAAFAALRDAIRPWVTKSTGRLVCLGGDSNDGEWSVIFEDGIWKVFVGERGQRYSISTFKNAWDAVSYAGYRATSGKPPDIQFPTLFPSIQL